MSLQPHLIRTPEQAVAQRIVHRIPIGERTFEVEAPHSMDALLDDPTVQQAFAVDEYMPYWADIWPASRFLAERLMQEDFTNPDGTPQSVLELGCGLGLAGLAALARGANVLFTDYEVTALQFVEANARRNGFERFQTMALDWRTPPADLRVPVILAADLIYEHRNIAPLLALLEQVLLPGGVCWLSDLDRPPAEQFRQAIARTIWQITTSAHQWQAADGRIRSGTIYRIQFPV